MGDEIQAIRYQSRETIISLKRQSARRESEFQGRIMELQKLLNQTQQTYQQFYTSLQERADLKEKYEILEKRYKQDSMDWEDLLESNQDERMKEHDAMRLMLQELKEEHRVDKIKALEDQKTVYEEEKKQFQDELAESQSKLAATTALYEKAREAVYILDETVRRLQEERNSLACLSRRSAQVVVGRVTNVSRRVGNAASALARNRRREGYVEGIDDMEEMEDMETMEASGNMDAMGTIEDMRTIEAMGTPGTEPLETTESMYSDEV